MQSRQKKLQNLRDNLPRLWLLTDARNDATLNESILRLPKGSGVIFRHYHMEGAERRTRFHTLQKLADDCGHAMILSGKADLARQWNADGIYGPPEPMKGTRDLLRLVTAHSADELARANDCGADAVFISPVFPTRSHIGAVHLGVPGFTRLAEAAHCPIIALGGVTAQNYGSLPDGLTHGWAAIDGLSDI